MKPPKALRQAQQAMRRRSREQRSPGRPPLAIDEERVAELLLAGYSPRGIALELDCSARTLTRCFPHLLAEPRDLPRFLDRLLFKLAVRDHDPQALLMFARRLEKQDRRRAERDEEAEIQKRIRGEQ